MIWLNHALLVLNMLAASFNVSIGHYGTATFNVLLSLLLMFQIHSLGCRR